MSRTYPRWLSRALGLPGAVTFRRYEAYVQAAQRLTETVNTLSDDSLSARAAALTMRTGGVLPRDATTEFLAIVREAAARTTGLKAFDEQLLACCALLSGHAVEMDTGEGKTLVGALAAAGHALAGRKVHVLSVNDYLAERDAEWMRSFFELLGLSVGWIGQHSPHAERQELYRLDIVYAPVSEIGFDVLRDRFAVADHDRVDPVFDAAIIDEADAVMIDEAMVPLVLAGTADGEVDDFAAATALVDSLVDGRDYEVDDDQATVTLTDAGLDLLETSLGGINLYASENIATLTRINLALHARVLVRRDVDYLVEAGSIKLINAGRGRVAHRQRWPDGLHAAIEAKERLAVSAPGVILDSITIQDLLLGYRTLSGMSGTVVSVAEDLLEFYKLPAGRVGRHLPNHRIDLPDQVFVTEQERSEAIIAEIVSRHATGQPVLVGTRDVAESELIASLARSHGMEPRVLNAKNDAEEAAVIARAGEHSAVTISTQMSGRGTDIRLGVAQEAERDRVIAAGGLAVIATGRYPSRRLDAQLRGRAGRQGDPGTSITFVSLDDALVRANAPAHLLSETARHGATLPSSRRQHIVDASQAIAEAARFSRHRATWMYTRAIAAQRATVLAHRRDITAEDATPLRSLIPAHLTSLDNETAVVATVRAVALYYLDEHWMQHLALVQDVRDGIHLRALAGQKPADEFHSIALREFDGFFDAVYRDAARFLEALSSDQAGLDLDELGLRRPSATWTYMVSDDPFGSPGDRLAKELGKRWRTRVLRIE